MESVYRPLVGEEVRFVRIQPGAWTDPIRCGLVYLPLPNAEVDVVEAWFSGRPLPKLLHEELYDPRPSSTTGNFGEGSTATAPKAEIPSFVALSYVWGDSTHTGRLLLDGQSVQKTTNLIAGVRQLRALLGNPDIFCNSSTLFWIDALCINQSDTAEKSAQVPRMAAIYGAAEFVLAWLGENGDDDDEVQEFINLVNTNDLQDRERTPAGYSRIINALNSTKVTHILDAYMSLCQRPWFGRIWVIQETLMSRYTVVLAGSYWCDYKHLSSACIATGRGHIHDPVLDELGIHVIRPVSHTIFASALRETIQSIFEERSATSRGSLSVASQNEVGDEDYDQYLSDFNTTDEGSPVHSASIFQDWTNDAKDLWEMPAVAQEYLSTKLLTFLLRAAASAMFDTFAATIPHDYLYGIISLGGITIFPRNLAPDYTLPFEAVFHQYTELILRHTGDLAIIPRMRHGLKGVPSWVPDYRSSRVYRKLPVEDNLSVNPDVSVSDDGLVCSTRGAHLGDVTLVLDYSCSDGYEEERANTNNRIDHFLEHVCKQTQLNKQDIVGEIDHAFKHSGYPEFRDSKFQEGYDDYASEFASAGSQGKLSKGDMWAKVTRTLKRYGCFSTSRGFILHLIRIDEQPRKGDVLVLLKGADKPWLLRPMDESNAEVYTFVGACRMLYRNPRSSGMEDWPLDLSEDVPEELLRHFFESNDVREFCLV